MSDKSYVSMEQRQCFVCGEKYDTGAILLDKHLRNSMARTTVTGTGLCPEHQAKVDEGYVILIGSDPNDTRVRTGDVVYVRASVWDNIFNVPLPEKRIAFMDKETLEALSKMQVSGD